MRDKPALLIALLALSLPAVGCGNDKPKTTYACAGAAKLEIDPSLSTKDEGDGAFSVPKGDEVDIGLKAVDASGAECDPAGTDVTVSDPALLVLSRPDGHAVLKATKDFFDAGGAEPSATLTATANGVSKSWTVSAVLNLKGKWSVQVDMVDFGTFDFVQHGRTLSYSTTSDAGFVAGDMLTLNPSTDPMQMGLVLMGSVASDRNHVSGSWNLGMNSGKWTATRSGP